MEEVQLFTYRVFIALFAITTCKQHFLKIFSRRANRLAAHVNAHSQPIRNGFIRAAHCVTCDRYFLGDQWNTHLLTDYHKREERRLQQHLADENRNDDGGFGDFDMASDDIYAEINQFPITYGAFLHRAEWLNAPEDDPRNNTAGEQCDF